MNRRNQMPDGTYKAGSKHGPKHRGEKGEWHKGHWFPAPPDFLPLEERGKMPFTVPDRFYCWHSFQCICHACSYPEAAAVKEERHQAMLRTLRKA